MPLQPLMDELRYWSVPLDDKMFPHSTSTPLSYWFSWWLFIRAVATVRSVAPSPHKTHFPQLLIKLFDLLFKCLYVYVSLWNMHTSVFSFALLLPEACTSLQLHEESQAVLINAKWAGLFFADVCFSSLGPCLHTTKINPEPVLQFGRGRTHIQYIEFAHTYACIHTHQWFHTYCDLHSFMHTFSLFWRFSSLLSRCRQAVLATSKIFWL